MALKEVMQSLYCTRGETSSPPTVLLPQSLFCKKNHSLVDENSARFVDLGAEADLPQS